MNTASPAVAVPTLTDSSANNKQRLESIDLIRGIAMNLMLLDHVRDFFSNVTFNPLDPQKTWLALFLTRRLSNFAAPLFVFLAGISAYILVARGKSKREVSRYLIIRGIWLIILELTLVHVGWTMDPRYHIVNFQAIWTIGWSMIILAGLIHLPMSIIALFGAVNVLLHNLLDKIPLESFGAWKWFWAALHVPTTAHPWPNMDVIVLFPLIPWVGVMALGYVFGQLFFLPAEVRRQWMLRIGMGLMVAFFIIRATNFYGDPRPWSMQAEPLRTAYSFLFCQKYPPSMLYLFIQLGPMILLMPFLEGHSNRFTAQLAMFGRVPLFYYIAHLYVLQLMATVACYFQHGQLQFGFVFFLLPPGNKLPTGYGYNLPGVYLAWLIAALLLFPLCHWFAQLKQRSRNPWLKYL
jgi:uncharacterized membrane protein